LLFGAGFKGKVGSSLAHGVPVIATSIAQEGTGVEPGDAILVADEPAAFAAHVVRLHDDAEIWRAAATRAIAHCEALYSQGAARETYAAMLAELGLVYRERGPGTASISPH
jgi:glycosyltransferase involved in cell wall biosynthesis